MDKTSLRHGDWSFIPTTEKIAGKKIETGKDFIFGEGEATGHMHALHVPTIDDMEWYKQEDGSWMVVVKNEAYATHPEHSMKVDLKIAPGTYRVRQAREKDWFSLTTRQVID